MSKLLLTGFDPFGGESINPSMELLSGMPDAIRSLHIHKLVLPTSFLRAPEILLKEIHRLEPDAVLCIGQAGGRTSLSFEKIGVNRMQGRIADNDGFQPEGCAIHPNGPDGLFSTMPVEEMARSVCSADIPAQVSLTAGTFVCNCVLYRLLLDLKERKRSIPAGFLHVPYSTKQAANKPAPPPSMSIRDMETGLYAALSLLEQRL